MHSRNLFMRRFSLLCTAAILAGTVLWGPCLRRDVLRWRYPQKYAAIVQHWSKVYGVDPLLIYTVVRTESSFNPTACSHVDARGLMQITEETFLWIKSQIAPNETILFGDLYDPEVNIRFGSYYLQRCLSRYHNDIRTAAAAYHSGWGTVDALLKTAAYSDNGESLRVFPYCQMKNYVAKISGAYAKYQLIYPPEGA